MSATTERTWHDGPPPHIGWWNAARWQSPNWWRWWDGEFWSGGVRPHASGSFIAGAVREHLDESRTEHVDRIQWTHYWPENARVPRIDPRVTPAPELCVDEGCPQHGTPHVCIDSSKPSTVKAMKVPTRTLIGHALDWAVATCEGATREDGCFRWPDGRISYGVPLYSTQPSQAWPIIDRENITVGPHTTSPAIAHYGPQQAAADQPWEHRWVGPTKLIAAMRCFVAKRLGDEIEIPEEFL